MHRLLGDPRIAALGRELGPATVKRALDELLAAARSGAATGHVAPSFDMLVGEALERLAALRARGLVRVLNGTGIVLHTNLGRAPLSAAALDAVRDASRGYTNLEYDLDRGARGSRHERVTELLRELTGAEDALVVNNCAAAVLLALEALARAPRGSAPREIVVSRGELVEIGGGFRLPEILEASGARLVEVGTTNKTYLRDVARALSPQTALLLRSHPANYRVRGFVHAVDGRELAELGRRAGVPSLEDLGSGALIDLARFGLPHERTVAEAVADGLDLVAFSADKLLGGPQAGIIVGRASPIARLRAAPLLRAVRPDKATLAALGATLRSYLSAETLGEIPLYAMLGAGLETLRARAERLVGASATWPPQGLRAESVPTTSSTGGGSLPLTEIPSHGVALWAPGGPARLAARLRGAGPPVIGLARADRVIVDLRTIAPSEDVLLDAALRTVADASVPAMRGGAFGEIAS